MIFNLVWLPARQTGSSTRTKALFRIMLRDTMVREDELVKQALMPKMMLHRAEARAALGRGVAKLTLAVQGTLGPKGMNAIIDRPIGTPIVSRDGVSIADEVELPCRFENMGAQVVREVSKQTNEVAGDGTTTATVLANALIQDGLKVLDSDTSPVDLVAGIERACDLVTR